MSTAHAYRQLASAQGVLRPYEILVRMHARNRRMVADMLGCRSEPVIDPNAQAWRIINQNLRGLQARTHTLPEQLSPFSRNNNWWEIVTRTAGRLGISFYAGQHETEVERLVFERFAERFAATRTPREAGAVDSVANSHPVLQQLTGALRLSRGATRGLLTAMAWTNDGLREGCQLLADWFMAPLRWTWAVSINTSLQQLQQRSNDVFAHWTKFGRTGGGADCVGAAVAVIYFQDLIDRAVEEFERQ